MADHPRVGRPLRPSSIARSATRRIYAGTSFLTTDKLGKFEFGSKIVNLVADKTQERAIATCGYDDDGVKTTRWHADQGRRCSSTTRRRAIRRT